MARKLTFREYSAIMILAVFSLTMTVNFSGSIINTYSTGDTDSETLQQIKSETKSQRTDIATLRNRTENVNVDEGAFLSPQGFSIVSDTLGNVADLPSIANTAVSELGLPPGTILLVAIPIAALLFEALSLLFGIRT